MTQELILWIPGWGWAMGFQNIFTGLIEPSWAFVNRQKINREQISQLSIDSFEECIDPRGE